jgi:isopropylmalate/homocitrate/citramalate synthase
MAGAEEICEALTERSFSAIGLVLNTRGLERASVCDLDEINLVAYASDGYAEKNSGAPAVARNDEAMALVPQVATGGMKVSVTISVAWGDPIDGEVPPERVAEIAGALAAAGADEIALGDTIGVAVPPTVREVVERVRDAAPTAKVRCHFHNTHNTGYANALAAIAAGADTLDSAVGGFGGSPFSPDAGGNIATEDLTWMLHRMGHETGIDAEAMAETAGWLAERLGHDAAPGMLSRAARWPG